MLFGTLQGLGFPIRIVSANGLEFFFLINDVILLTKIIDLFVLSSYLFQYCLHGRTASLLAFLWSHGNRSYFIRRSRLSIFKLRFNVLLNNTYLY